MAARLTMESWKLRKNSFVSDAETKLAKFTVAWTDVHHLRPEAVTEMANEILAELKPAERKHEFVFAGSHFERVMAEA
jgi:hypothetical protein